MLGGQQDLRRLDEPPCPTQPQASGPRSGPTVANAPAAVGAQQPRQVRLGDRVLPHVDVHGRRQQHRRARRQHHRRQQIVGHAGREARDRVGGRRRDDDQVGLVGQADVPDLRLLGQVEELAPHRVARQRLHRERRDELRRGLGEDHPHVGARLDQQAAELGRLVGGDAAGHPQDDPAAIRGRPATGAEVDVGAPPAGRPFSPGLIPELGPYLKNG